MHNFVIEAVDIDGFIYSNFFSSSPTPLTYQEFKNLLSQGNENKCFPLFGYIDTNAPEPSNTNSKTILLGAYYTSSNDTIYFKEFTKSTALKFISISITPYSTTDNVFTI